MVPAPMTRFAEFFRFRLTAGAVALGLICVLSLGAQGLGWSGAKDSVDVLTGFFAPLLFLLAIVWRDFRQAWRKLLQSMLASSKHTFILVFDPLFCAAIGAKVAARVAVLAIAPPLPRIVDVNLTPRLLPIPRAPMGAAI